MNLKSLLIMSLVLGPPRSQAETSYPVLGPAFAFAAARHAGESRWGTVGAINKHPEASLAELHPVCSGEAAQTRCWLGFDYAFRASDAEEFAGIFVCAGRCAIDTVNPDGTAGPPIDLSRDGTFNFRRPFLNSMDSGASITSVRIVLRAGGQQTEPLTLRVQIQDQDGQQMYRRVTFDPAAAAPAVFDLPIAGFAGRADLGAVKTLAIVVEERHVADGVRNPASGSFLIESISLVDGSGPQFSVEAVRDLDDKALVSVLARHDFEALLRLADGKTGFVLDRTLYRDLLAISGTGWLLGALPAAARLGWIPEEEARRRALRILRFTDDDRLYCDLPAACLANSRGILYRFLGVDPSGLSGPLTGTRKVDLGRVNAVEASVLDTGIFLYGVAAFAAGFPDDREIQDRSRAILGRTKWNELVDRNGQLMMAWKPVRDETPGSYYTAPAPFGGFWASRDLAGNQPLTLDYWTEEIGFPAILGAGSETSPTTAAPWYRATRRAGAACGGAVLTYPGGWFSYAFLSSTFLDPALGPDRGREWGTIALDPPANAARVFQASQALSPPGEIVLRDAIEFADTTYGVQAYPECAVDGSAGWVGARSPYSLQLALGLGGTVAEDALKEIRRLLNTFPAVYDPLWGFLDSYQPDLADFPSGAGLLRSSGPWVQQQVWSLNKGAALVAQLNFLADGAVWKTANQHPVIQRGIDKIYKQPAVPCAYSLSPDNASFGASGGTGSISVTAPTGCSWTATSSAPWIAIPSPSGQGSGTVKYTVAANASFDTRTASISVAGSAVSVKQEGQPAPQTILLEAEKGTGSGQIMTRPSASGTQTVWLHAGETRTMTFSLPAAASYKLVVRYSNDNFGPEEVVELRVDGSPAGQFTAEGVSNYGLNWDVFYLSPPLGPIDLPAGQHSIQITPRGGDGYGIEIDLVRLDRS